MKATSKATNVNASAKRASKAHPTSDQMVSFCVAAFGDVMTADSTLQNAKALWDAARAALRVELARAYKVIAHGKAWDTFKADLRAALVKAGVVTDTTEAGRLINNALIALHITGAGSKKGGRKAGAGRPEQTETGEATTVSKEGVTARMVAALAYIADAQQRLAGDDDMLAELGAIAAILGGKE